jgi:hypothetical protein
MTQPDEQDELQEPTVTPVPEPDQDEADEEAATEPTVPQEPEDGPAELSADHGPTQEEWEERHREAEAKFRTYTRAVGKIYEEQANDYLPCPLCSDPPAGFIHPASVGQFPDEVMGAVMMLLGQTNTGDVPDDPYSHPCATCGGWGVVRTGSRVPNQEVRGCLDCRGLGYQPNEPAGEPPAGVLTATSTTENGGFVPSATGPESPEIEALRLRGYTIVPPMQMGS